MFNVGDKVKLKNPDMSEDDYRFGYPFINEGFSGVIGEVLEADANDNGVLVQLNDDALASADIFVVDWWFGGEELEKAE